MDDNIDEAILDLQTNKPKIVKLENLRELSKRKSPEIRRKQLQHFVLYVIDSVISLVFVAPMVISFWRGTWTLLDIHADLFPPYETGALGITIHMCFILVRQFVKDYFEQDSHRAKRNPSFVIARRFYTYIYSVMSVMQWRGCWTAFDHLFVDEETGSLTWIIIATVSSTSALVMLKSLTNSLATPCILILDSVDACYNIPTRFRIVIILVLALTPTKQNVIYAPQAKKIDNLELIDNNAHPFQNIVKGSVPSPFKISPKHYPTSIQDVIENSESNLKLLATGESSVQQTYNLGSPRPNGQRTSFNPQSQHDPFYSFKPQDISEVNLLATHGFRFAPPNWIDLNGSKKKKQVLGHSEYKPSVIRGDYRFLKRDHRDQRNYLRESRYYLNVYHNS